ARTETNLFAQVEHGDKSLSRDNLLDQLDAVLGELRGKAALAAIEEPGNQIQRAVQAACMGLGPYDDCYKNILARPDLVAQRADALAAFDAAVSQLPAADQALLHQMGELRLAGNAAFEYPAQFVGPSGSAVLDYRMDDASLAALFDDGGGTRMTEAIYRYLEATNINRDSTTALAEQRAKLRADSGKKAKIAALAQLLDGVAQDYQRLASAEDASVEGIGQVGAQALKIDFALDEAGRADYE